jgi:glutamate dehydrogenase/leucine dehydrogenase
MPMSYWTFRSEASGYADGFAYNEESTRRLRNDLGDQSAVVHGIGGIGDLVTPPTLAAFAASLVATHSVGGSIYDWVSMTPASRDAIAAAFRGSGDAAMLPRGPSG